MNTTPNDVQHERLVEVEVVDQEVRLQFKMAHTVYDLMSFVCQQWLDDVRGVDGGIDEHLWTIQSSLGEHASLPFNGQFEESVDQSTPLSALNLLEGSTLRVQYDYGNATHFVLRIVSLSISGDLAFLQALPCLVPSADSLPAGFAMYAPPTGLPSLDTLFPHLSTLCFHSIARWLMFFPMKSCAGAIEAGPGAMCDMLTALVPFEGAESFFIAADRAAALQPHRSSRADAYCRYVIPTALSAQEEEAFKVIKNRALHSLDADWWGPEESVTRLSPPQLAQATADLRNTGFDFAQAFPRCAAAYHERIWISYRRGVLRVCQGMTSAKNRGLPLGRAVQLARVSHKIHSLQELFCLTESLLATLPVPASRKRKA
ncbi:hypothetical protein B484DRAFT_451876 [Ochromonadaceae sp. CCMP2298]|nr:hypothetical protein B484DRAFT_451876 [Ochromonadaceae sp. CCMP2298]